MDKFGNLMEAILEEGIGNSNILAWRIPMERGAWQGTVHGVTKSQTITLSQKYTCKHNFAHSSGAYVFPWWLRWQSSLAMQETWVQSLHQEWQPTPVFLPGEFHGQRGHGSWGCKGPFTSGPHGSSTDLP